MASLLHVGTATSYAGLSSFEKWVVDELTGAGHTIGAYKAYADAEVTSGYDAVIVHARGAHGLGTRYRNCGMPTVGFGRDDLYEGSGSWNHATTINSPAGNNMYYDDDSQVVWTGQTVDNAVNINANGTQLQVTASLDADALIACRHTDASSGASLWLFDAGEVVDGVTLSAKMAGLGLNTTYWQAGVANAAGEQLLLDIVTWLLDSGATTHYAAASLTASATATATATRTAKAAAALAGTATAAATAGRTARAAATLIGTATATATARRTARAAATLTGTATLTVTIYDLDGAPLYTLDLTDWAAIIDTPDGAATIDLATLAALDVGTGRLTTAPTTIAPTSDRRTLTFTA